MLTVPERDGRRQTYCRAGLPPGPGAPELGGGATLISMQSIPTAIAHAAAMLSAWSKAPAEGV